MMKSAEELFKELGYKFKDNGYGFITYEFDNGIENPTVIEFDDDGTFIVYIKHTKEPVYLNFEMLKAINKQYEEMGYR